jgi:hypothetical protein
MSAVPVFSRCLVLIKGGDAQIQTPASWGQGESASRTLRERGAEGYQDSATSEIFASNELQTGQE